MNRRKFLAWLSGGVAALLSWRWWKSSKPMPLTRRTLFSDDFNHSGLYLPVVPHNYSPLGSTLDPPGDDALGPNWNYDFTKIWGARDWAVLNGGVRSWYGSAIDEAFYTGVLPNDQWAQVQYRGPSGNEGGSNGVVAVSVRMDSSSDPNADLHSYTAWYYAFSGDWYLVAGHFTGVIFAQGTGTPLAAGDIIRIEAQGSQIRMYRNDVLITQITDTSFASGTAGFQFNGQFDNGPDNLPVPVIESFAAGDWTDGPPPDTSEEPYIFITT